MPNIQELSKASRRAIFINHGIRYIMYFLLTVFAIQFLRSLYAYEMGFLSTPHLVRVNVYFVVLLLITPTILMETRYRILQARNNEM